MNLNLKAQQENTYDAIVVGTGISGGWAGHATGTGAVRIYRVELSRGWGLNLQGIWR